MEFKKITKISKLLDPFQNFIYSEKTSEVRFDPLTGLTTRILDFPVKQLQKEDLTDIAEKTKGFCPFCPEMIDTITPKFDPALLPNERYTRGEAVCFPNAFPYDENGAVTVISHAHYIPIENFSAGLIADALVCSIEYLADVAKKQPDAVYQSINWNFLPLAGSSIIHPHLQVMASSTPTNYYTGVLSSLERYRKHCHSDFWTDLVEEEKSIGERFIKTADGTSWLIAFAPMGIFDVLGIPRNVRKPEDVTIPCAEAIASSLTDILRFIGTLNMHSFNMAFYFVTDNGIFSPHIRLCPRISLPPLATSEINYMKMLHSESLSTMKPEDVCAMIREFWK